MQIPGYKIPVFCFFFRKTLIKTYQSENKTAYDVKINSLHNN
jgi:hypothetical protein